MADRVSQVVVELLTLPTGGVARVSQFVVEVFKVGNVTANITGVGSTGSVGTVTVAATAVVRPSGVQASGIRGTLVPVASASVTLTGVQGSGQRGSLQTVATASAHPSGVEGDGQAGTAGFKADAQAFPSGASLHGHPGTLEPVANAEFTIASVQGTTHLGTVVGTGLAIGVITGVHGTSHIGPATADLVHEGSLSLRADIAAFFGEVKDAILSCNLDVSLVFLSIVHRFLQIDIEVDATFTGKAIHHATLKHEPYTQFTATFNPDYPGFSETQAIAELVALPDDPDLNVTQAIVEIGSVASDPDLNLTEAVSETLIKPQNPDFYLTQAIVEILSLRVTQGLAQGVSAQCHLGPLFVEILEPIQAPIVYNYPVVPENISFRPIKGRIAARFSGSRIAEFNDGPFRVPNPANPLVVAGTNTDPIYGEPLKSRFLQPFVIPWNPVPLLPDPTDRMFNVLQGHECRLDIISQIVFGRADLWWSIAYLNQIINPFEQPRSGDRIRIPTFSRVVSTFGQVSV